jgi:hypothetical protein
MTGTHGVVRLDDNIVYEGVYAIKGGWVTLVGRARHRANGGVLYSKEGQWTWPARRIASIKASQPEGKS